MGCDSLAEARRIRHILYKALDSTVVPVVRAVAAMGVPRVLSTGSAMLRHIRWKTKLLNLGHYSELAPCVVIHNPQVVSIGSHVSIGEFVHIWGYGGVTIGDHVLIAGHAVITSLTHEINTARLYRQSLAMSHVYIEDNVWIGAGAIILPGVRVGKNSIIGAGAVVTHDVPPNTIVAGVPARVMRQVE